MRVPITTAVLLDHVQRCFTNYDHRLSREGYVYSEIYALLPNEDLDEDRIFSSAYDYVDFGNVVSLKAAKSFVRKTWKPNPTLFVSAFHASRHQINHSCIITKRMKLVISAMQMNIVPGS